MFSDVLKHLRKINNITQRELAESLNLERTTIGKYESHNVMPNVETLYKLADFFNVSMDELMDYKKKEVFEIPDSEINSQVVAETNREDKYYTKTRLIPASMSLLNTQERLLIELFRLIDEKDRTSVIKYVRFLRAMEIKVPDWNE